MENIEIIRFKKLLTSETKRRWGSLKRYWGHQDSTTREQRECQNNERCNKKNDNFAHHTFLYISLPYLHDYDVKISRVLRRM